MTPKPSEPRMVIRRVVTFDYEIAADAWEGYTNSQALTQEKAMSFHSWIQQTSFDIVSDDFQIVRERKT